MTEFWNHGYAKIELSPEGFPKFELDAIWVVEDERAGVVACAAGTEGAFIGVYMRPAGQGLWCWLADFATLEEFNFHYEGFLRVRDATVEPNHHFLDYSNVLDL